MQIAINILLAYYILKYTYSEGSVFGFLLRKLYYALICLFDFKDIFNTLRDISFFCI